MDESAATYTNPVSKTFADTFAGPAMIKAKDGYWYAYGTSEPLREGEEHKYIPVSPSEDLVNWEYVGDTFDTPSDVSWAAGDAGSGLRTSAAQTASTICTRPLQGVSAVEASW